MRISKIMGLAREPLQRGDVVRLTDGRSGFIRARIFGLTPEGDTALSYEVQLHCGRGAVEVTADRVAVAVAVAA